MPCLPQPQLAFGIDIGSRMAKITAIFRFGRDEIEPRHGFDGEAQGPGHSAHLGSEPAQDAANLALLVALEDDALGAESRHFSGLDKDGLAGAARAMDDAGKLV